MKKKLAQLLNPPVRVVQKKSVRSTKFESVNQYLAAIVDSSDDAIIGKDLAERLKNLKPDMKILYMSGYTRNVIVHHGVVDEGLHFIEKPFAPDALMRKVREVLDEKK